jgi:hypothetical protein
MTRYASVCSAVLLLLLAVYGGSADQAPSSPRLVTGAWGGQHIALRAGPQGAQIDLDCARATIAKAIVLDSKDHFDVTGSFVNRGGTQPEGGSEATSAHFSGYVRDGTMHLIITSIQSSEVLGNFTLKQGARSHIARCL